MDSHEVYQNDDTLSKLNIALEEANTIDLRGGIEKAIQNRKKELREQNTA